MPPAEAAEAPVSTCGIGSAPSGSAFHRLCTAVPNRNPSASTPVCPGPAHNFPAGPSSALHVPWNRRIRSQHLPPLHPRTYLPLYLPTPTPLYLPTPTPLYLPTPSPLYSQPYHTPVLFSDTGTRSHKRNPSPSLTLPVSAPPWDFPEYSSYHPGNRESRPHQTGGPAPVHRMEGPR